VNNQGIGSWTARRARKTPDRTALIHENRAISYADLHDRSTRLAHLLRAHGVARGDRVAFLGPNHPSFLLTLFACGQLGAVFLPLNTRLAPAELRYQLADSGTRTLLYVRTDPAGLPADHLIEAERQGFDDLLLSSPAEFIDEPVGLDDLCMIMYTSGTTGRPKGALLTHGNITWNSLNVVVDVDLTSDEVTLVSAPLFHTAALNMTCLPTLLKGGTAVLETSFDAPRVLRLIDEYKITCLFGVPAMFDMLAAAPGFAQTDLSTVRNLLCGGAPVPARTIRLYLDRGLRFVQGYGMTEASPGVLLLDRRDAVDHAGTAGVPHFFTDVRLRPAAPSETEPGEIEVSEIEVSGPHVSSGYWGGEPRPDPWFRTGDLAVRDAGRYFRLVDRVSDLYISGGENVYPAEVEDAILDHPGVAECAVFGVPDETWGETGRAVVVPRPGVTVTAQDVLNHLGPRLARYKIPKSVIFTDALPRSGAGKVLKRPLRDRFGRHPEGDPS
jgi:fatty-acyl-CoA synthase